MPNPTTGTIIVADPGWHGERDIPVGDLAVGWRVNGVGRASFRLPARTSHLLGWRELMGRWATVPLGGLGPWGGIIEDVPGDITTGIVELSCADFGVVLDHRITPRSYRQITSSAGELIGRAIRDTALDEPLVFDTVFVDGDGPAITIEYRGDPLGRVVQSLASGANGAWNVTVSSSATIDFTYHADYTDKRGELILHEGYNVIAGSIRPSIRRAVNDLLAVANDRDWQRSGAARVEDASSILSYGRRQASQRYPGHTRRSSLETVARADVDRLSLPTSAVSVEVPAWDKTLYELREGDLVTLVSAVTNRTLDFAVAARAYEANRGTVTLVGTATEQA